MRVSADNRRQPKGGDKSLLQVIKTCWPMRLMLVTWSAICCTSSCLSWPAAVATDNFFSGAFHVSPNPVITAAVEGTCRQMCSSAYHVSAQPKPIGHVSSQGWEGGSLSHCVIWFNIFQLGKFQFSGCRKHTDLSSFSHFLGEDRRRFRHFLFFSVKSSTLAFHKSAIYELLCGDGDIYWPRVRPQADYGWCILVWTWKELEGQCVVMSIRNPVAGCRLTKRLPVISASNCRLFPTQKAPQTPAVRWGLRSQAALFFHVRLTISNRIWGCAPNKKALLNKLRRLCQRCET